MRILLGLAIAIALAVIAARLRFRHDMAAARARLRGRSQVLASPLGDIEYAEGGRGRPVLVIHGSGGGFDQGELVARTVLGDDVRWIAPSRFGYLRSALPPAATFDDQADAYAFLLDHLELERVAVVALSHGGPSALLFAALHPERVSSLTLVSCGVTSMDDPAQTQANRHGDALAWIFAADARYWALTRLLRKRFLALMGADAKVVAGLTAEERRLVDEVVDFMNPVSLRSAGAAFDNRAVMPNERIAAIRAPTLVFHARDDTLQLHRHAEYAAATIPGARLVSFKRGGHLMMVVEREAIRTDLCRFLAVST